MATEQSAATTEDQSVEETPQPVVDERKEQEEQSTEDQSVLEPTDTTENPRDNTPPPEPETNEQEDVPPTEPEETGHVPPPAGVPESLPTGDTTEQQTGQEGADPDSTQPTGPVMSVVVIGGTGAIGKHLVAQLLQAKDKVGKVTLIGRRKQMVPEQYGINLEAEETQGRLIQHVEDMDAISNETVQGLCTGANVFYCTLGTTRLQAGSAEAFHHIDYDIPIKCIRAAKAAGVATCSLVTSGHSNSSSFFLFPRTKGELEDATRACGFPFTMIYRPGPLDRGEDMRFGEKMASIFIKGMPVATVARAMINDSYRQFTSSGEAGAANNFTISNNSAINQSAQ